MRQIIRSKFIKGNETPLILAEWSFFYRNITTGITWERGPYVNKVVQGGLNNMAALLIGEVPSNTAAMHIVIGDSATAAQIDDDITDMGEVYRKAIAAKTRTGGQARLRAFLLSGEGNGDHQCVGVVARSTDLSGSGTLLNRLVQPFSKKANTELTVEIRWIFQEVSA